MKTTRDALEAGYHPKTSAASSVAKVDDSLQISPTSQTLTPKPHFRTP